MLMPNIGALLKQEILRLSRRETRAQLQPVQKASAQYRRHIAGLKRQVATLERLVALLQRRAPDNSAVASTRSATTKVRFVAKGLKSQRDRLGLSASEYGELVGVSANSVYNWEQGHAAPRPEQVQKIAALRGVGKREVQRRLEQLATKNRPKARAR
jgi:DNA-binding transcriptional regulator YiaG